MTNSNETKTTETKDLKLSTKSGVAITVKVTPTFGGNATVTVSPFTVRGKEYKPLRSSFTERHRQHKQPGIKCEVGKKQEAFLVLDDDSLDTLRVSLLSIRAAHAEEEEKRYAHLEALLPDAPKYRDGSISKDEQAEMDRLRKLLASVEREGMRGMDDETDGHRISLKAQLDALKAKTPRKWKADPVVRRLTFSGRKEIVKTYRCELTGEVVTHTKRE